MPALSPIMATRAARSAHREVPAGGRSRLLRQINELLPDGVREVTYRQFDYWVSNGYITIGTPNPGSGGRRELSEAEILAVVAMATRISELEAELNVIASGEFFKREVTRELVAL